MYSFSVSLMCMDLLNLRQQLEFLNGVADFYHVDIMDGHYVPNITLSPFFIESLKRVATLPLDAHLMVTRPETISPLCLSAGADYISFHAETVDARAFRLIDAIKAAGAKPGVVFNPETGPESARYYLDQVDKITIMTVDPGFSRQEFVRACLKKIEELRDLKEKHGYRYTIEVDGACNAKTFHDLAATGAEIFVLGNTGLFGLDPDLGTAWARMKENFETAVAGIK
jgi:D-allulose-6-phosphate 3-epimerase